MRSGRPSSSLSNKSNSTPLAPREKRLKFAPPSVIVEPKGELRPILAAEFIYCHNRQPARHGIRVAMLPAEFFRQPSMRLRFRRQCRGRHASAPFQAHGCKGHRRCRPKRGKALRAVEQANKAYCAVAEKGASSAIGRSGAGSDSGMLTPVICGGDKQAGGDRHHDQQSEGKPGQTQFGMSFVSICWRVCASKMSGAA